MKKAVLLYGILGGLPESDKFAKLYDNPAINAAITFLEPLPVALVVALMTVPRARTGDPTFRWGRLPRPSTRRP